MKDSPRWLILRVDGRIACVSTVLSDTRGVLQGLETSKVSWEKIEVTHATTDELFEISRSITWEDLCIVGTEFQKSVWKGLFDITHAEGASPRLLSYSEFSREIGRPSSVRAVSHAIGLNHIPVIIPCHLIIPQESADRLREIEAGENSLFQWRTLYVVDRFIDYGFYSVGGTPSQGKEIKRMLIRKHLTLQYDQ